MFLTVPRDEAHLRLNRLGLTLAGTFFEATVELWKDAKGRDVYLTPELDGTGAYEEEMIRAVEAAWR